MFTGLIEAVGQIEAVVPSGGGRRLRVSTPFDDIAQGESVSVSGVCLTAAEPDGRGFWADVSPVTLEATTLDRLKPGNPVNLERALRADARLGGHFVLGHVDGVGRIRSLDPAGDYHRLEVEIPAHLAEYVIMKGSIAVDGVSLTVADMRADNPLLLVMQIVPFTFHHTAFAAAAAGDPVNLEADVLGKYVKRLLESGRADRSPESGGA